MTLNPQTYDLKKRKEFVDAWVQAHIELGKQDEDGAVFCPLGTRKRAMAASHQMNLVRAAMKAQRQDGWLYDTLKMSVVRRTINGVVTWGLRFTLRPPKPEYDFQFIVDRIANG